MRQVVAGVEAAHDEGILHRDLKPANIFLMQQKRKTGGEDGFVKVGDFGLAKIVNADRSDVTSASGPASRGIIGTPEYMAPEQMQPGEDLDARADIYALGTIAYHMLGGRPPFTGNITQLIAQKLTQAPPALSSLRSDISAEVEASIMKALAKELAAEGIRDNALAISGLLDPRIGGPSVKPYQPDGYWENLNFPPRNYEADKGENQYRRGLYTWWQRSYVHPAMLAFDAPTADSSCTRRVRGTPSGPT